MRTTLKSRLGRTAAANGNGTGGFPPAPLGPITLYRQPEPPPRRRGRLLLAVLGWAVVVLVICAVGVAGGLYLYLHQSVAAVAAKSKDVKIAARRLKAPLPNEPANAIVIGYDHRANEAKGTPSRSDTIMLLRADPHLKTISLLSFPRDLLVPIHCPGKAPFQGRINSAYTYCGSQGTLETVKDLTHLQINYLIAVNFRGFKEIVDRLGGVYIDVDRRYLNTHGGPSGFATINLQPGYQLLGGQSALDFVRYRHTDSDIYRTARQQLFVKALKDRIKSSFSPLKLPRVVNAITRNVEVAQGGGHDVGARTVLRYALFAYGLPTGHVFQVKIEGLEGYAELSTSQDNLDGAVQRFVHPDVDSAAKATNVALGEKPKVKAPPANQTTITVLNGNGIEGSATTAGSLLSRRSYQILTPPSGLPANAPNGFDYFRSRVFYDWRQRGAKPAARKVASLFGSADIQRMPRFIRPYSNGAMLVTVVGQTFHNSLAAAPIDQTPRRQLPNVAPGTSAALDLLRERQRKVPFRLYVPTVIERSSWIDREKPIRLYRIDPSGEHKAVRLVYRLGGGNKYWGVEQTNWTKAPVLSDRNLTRRIGGRRYALYYSGPHLHMVVVRRSAASYWVVNTLLDELSNETMIAIAKGLRPINKVR
jgi:LCP family protein required for cell wall assembly